MTRLYFAYGSNMNPRQMAERCPAAEWLGRARLKGNRFVINQRGVATLTPDRRTSTLGVLWRITPACESALDLHEGVAWGYYYKGIVKVIDAQGRLAKSLVYIDPDCEVGLPRPGYLEKVFAGARLAGIPAANFRSYLKEVTRYAA